MNNKKLMIVLIVAVIILGVVGFYYFGSVSSDGVLLQPRPIIFRSTEGILRLCNYLESSGTCLCDCSYISWGCSASPSMVGPPPPGETYQTWCEGLSGSPCLCPI